MQLLRRYDAESEETEGACEKVCWGFGWIEEFKRRGEMKKAQISERSITVNVHIVL